MFRFSLKAIAIFILLTVIGSQISAFVSKKPINQSAIYHDHKVDFALNNTTVLSDRDDLTLSEEDDDCCQIECQDSHCVCFDNMCSSVVYLFSIDFNNRIYLGDDSSFLQPFDRIKRVQSYLYRPPIVSA